ncbi:MAG: hypothetical protein EOP62_12480 [Sphingomonadales bacterium]|nr:MAG: hypothetical protein EOP62_12480 [Sphingomonadales bacterium]
MGILVRSMLFVGVLAYGTAPTSGYAQDTPAQTTPKAKPGKNDILVTGRKGEKPRPNPMPPASAVFSRGVASDAGSFARCLNGDAPELQRIVIEGHVRDKPTQKALDKLIRSHAGCYPRFRKNVSTSNEHYGSCNSEFAGATNGYANPNWNRKPGGGLKGQWADFKAEFKICRAPYDRLAVVEEAFHTYAPHFMLTRADTLNKETVARFRAREDVRGKFRGPMDRTFYTTIACMVQLAPEESVRLLRAQPNSDREVQLREQILAKASYCTGDVKKVSVDPPQFRGYVADAVYHWTLAAKNVETLIPTG